MTLCIDGKLIDLQPGQSLLDLIRELGLDNIRLSQRPLAAKIAGEVFTLNYVPMREKDVSQTNVRAAVAASDGNVKLIRYTDAAGKELYTRTAQFVIFLALKRLWPQAKAKIHCTIGSGLFIELEKPADYSVERLKLELCSIIEANIPLLRSRTTTQSAIEYFAANDRQDKACLLRWRKADHYDWYSYGDFKDYYYGEMAPATGYLTVWDLLDADGGFVFILPDDQNPDWVASYHDSPQFLQVFTEGQRWCELMDCENVAELNELVRNGGIRELIRVNEA
ncbi:MAG: hypothetical protein IKY59_01930, partial [Oscillospiraceae bacterium]|nr:hypothetical protein [Oscillospiraceae bacterium]